ncbi:glycosyltransferase [Myxococcota bacterium]|nr:glycosyltransferase [Myxococcota bacterium]
MVEEIAPLVTCMMPTADRRRFVPGAIETFLRQTHSNRELLVVDDGEDVIADLIPADPRIRYLRLPKKATVGAKRNLACAEARGSLIAHWDDDDWYAPDRLAVQVELLRETGAELCGLSELVYFDLERRVAWEYRRTRGRLWLGMLCYRRRLWERHRFPDVERGSDTRFLWSLPEAVMRVVRRRDLEVRSLHGRNVSPKWTGGREWRRIDVARIRDVMKDDFPRYFAPSVRVGAAAVVGSAPGGSPTASAREAPVGSEPAPNTPRIGVSKRRLDGGSTRGLVEAVARELPELSPSERWDPRASAHFVVPASDLTEVIVDRAVAYVSSFQLDAHLASLLSRAARVVAAGRTLADWLPRAGVTRPVELVSPGFSPDIELRSTLPERFTVAVHGRSTTSCAGWLDIDGRPLDGGGIHGLDRIVAIARRLERRSVVFRLEAAHATRGSFAGELAALGHIVEIEPQGLLPRDRFEGVDVLLVASRTEGLPIEAFDALAAGVPVVASRVGELVHLTDETFETIDEAVARLEHAARVRTSALERGPALRARVSSLDRSTSAKRLAALLREVAAERGARPRRTSSTRAETEARAGAPPSPSSSPSGPPRIVSVLMTAWKTAPWIEQAMRSALDQSLPAGWQLELLVATDGCAESTEAARCVRDHRVSIVELASNGGTYRALNTLLTLARGEVIAILDSDDVACPGRLERQLAALEAEASLDYVGGQVLQTDSDLSGATPLAPFPTDPRGAFTRGRPAMSCHGTLTARRTLYDRLGGYDDTRIGGDWELVLRALAIGARGRNLPSVELLRRRHPAQLTRAPSTGVGSPARETYRARLAADEVHYRRGARPARIERAARTPIRTVHATVPRGTLIVMPTIPARADGARAVLAKLLEQSPEKVVVLLNGHASTSGWPVDSRVEYRLRPAGSGPAARLTVDACEFEVVQLVDDDIDYPSNYLASCRRELLRFGGGISYHGRHWLRGQTRYTARQTIHFTQAFPRAMAVPYVGTGVTAYGGRLSALFRGPIPRELELDDDLWLSATFGRAGIRFVRPPTSEGWLRARVTSGPSLWSSAVANRFAVREQLLARLRAEGWSPAEAREIP